VDIFSKPGAYGQDRLIHFPNPHFVVAKEEPIPAVPGGDWTLAGNPPDMLINWKHCYGLKII